MSLANKRDIGFAEISSFLIRHPDFFVEHPEILRQIVIPHDTVTGSNNCNISSLLEYQVHHLQQQLHDLESDNDLLKQGIEDQRKLAGEIHAFILQLLQARSIDNLYTRLQKGLRQYYAADRLVMLVFERTGTSSHHADLHFMDGDSKLSLMFTEIFHRDKPLCNSLQEEHLEALFGSIKGNVLSTVLLPMSDNERQSLMVLGSFRENRYHHGAELDLLLFISRIVNTRLRELLQW